MVLHLRPRRGALPLFAALAAAAALLGSCLQPPASFVPLGRLPATGPGAKGAAAAVAQHGQAGPGAKEPHPDPPQGASRRSSGLGLLLAAAAGLVVTARAGGARAFELESNRIATYNNKAKQLNDAVDWYVFDVRPLLFPPKEIMEVSSCEEFGDNCAERAGLSVISNMYQTQGATRGAGQIVVSKLERELFTPMKLLSMSSVFDPDTEDDLASDVQKMESSQSLMGRAAKKGDLLKVKQLYADGRDAFNSYFRKVNAATALPEKTEFYLQPIPSDSELESDKYWIRRKQKYLVKKKVDAVSKGNKTARFYAKTMFGDDAVSWDPRGDRAQDFYNQ